MPPMPFATNLWGDNPMLPPSLLPNPGRGQGQNQFGSFPTMTMPGSNNPSSSPANFAGGTNPFSSTATAVPFPGNPDIGNFGGGSGGFDLSAFGTSSSVPTSGTTPGTAPNQNPSMAASTQPLQFTGPNGASGMTGIGKGLFAQNPLDPALTSQFFQWLQSQIGQGVPGFNLSTILPSTGEATAPGQLNAPLNPVMQSLMKLFQPGGAIGDIASKGISAVGPWQGMVDAMQRNIDEGRTNLREQFGFAGNLDSSPFGTAMVDYQTQSNKDLNSLLGQMQFQGIQDQLAAGGMQEGFGQFMQGLDQQSIQNMLQEFIRTSPEYNPLLGMMFGASTTFPPVLNPKTGAGGLGGLLGGLGGAFGGIADLIPAIAGLFKK